MKDESEPLDFLEKSHCVPIILALYRNGMMNRNQLYDQLGETINIVIKRINFLIERDIVYEMDMKAKPFAKFIYLTGKGKAVAEKLENIEEIMEKPGTGSIGRLHIPFEPNEDDLMDESEISNSPQLMHDLELEIDERSRCPKCGNKMHIIPDKKKAAWICFKCGTRFSTDKRNAFKLWVLEDYRF